MFMSKNQHRKWLRRILGELNHLRKEMIFSKLREEKLQQENLAWKLRYRDLYHKKLTSIQVVSDKYCPPGTIYLIGEKNG